MQYNASRWFGRSWLVITAALASACADNAPLAPVDATTARRVAAAADVSDGNRLPDLPAGCEKLGAPVGSTLLLHAFGIGVQIYTWNGSSWGTAVPAATLYADEGGHGVVADHFAGPRWKSNSGSTVLGTVAERCIPDAASIANLALNAVSDGAPGLFQSVNFIQRLNTVGGNAPSTPGFLGQVAKIPYTADYLFYKTP